MTDATIPVHACVRGSTPKDRPLKEWAEEYRPSRGQRVVNLARPDYTDGSELSRSLALAVEAVARRIALAKLGQGE